MGITVALYSRFLPTFSFYSDTIGTVRCILWT